EAATEAPTTAATEAPTTAAITAATATTETAIAATTAAVAATATAAAMMPNRRGATRRQSSHQHYTVHLCSSSRSRRIESANCSPITVQLGVSGLDSKYG